MNLEPYLFSQARIRSVQPVRVGSRVSYRVDEDGDGVAVAVVVGDGDVAGPAGVGAAGAVADGDGVGLAGLPCDGAVLTGSGSPPGGSTEGCLSAVTRVQSRVPMWTPALPPASMVRTVPSGSMWWMSTMWPTPLMGGRRRGRRAGVRCDLRRG